VITIFKLILLEMRKKILPPTYFNATIVIMIILHFVFPIMYLIVDYWKLIGIIPLLGGIVLNLLADKSIKVNNTTVKPGQESEVLITKGVFRINRNPMYLGMGFIHLGIGVFLGSLTPFIVIPIFIYLIDNEFLAVEENMLRDKFGDHWIEYKNTTRKWI